MVLNLAALAKQVGQMNSKMVLNVAALAKQTGQMNSKIVLNVAALAKQTGQMNSKMLLLWPNRTNEQQLFVGWLLYVPATGLCISGMDLLRQFYVLPH